MTTPPGKAPWDPPNDGENGTLVPLLRSGEDLGDPDTLAAWRSALSNSLGTVLPHDLFALWLFPETGGAALIGPPELAADRLAVPEPLPRVPLDELAALEAVVRRAGYRSVLAAVVTHGGRDVGLMLWAALAEAQYGPTRRKLVDEIARQMAPLMRRSARHWSRAVRTAATHDLEALAEMLGGLAEECDAVRTPVEIVAAVARAVDPFLAQDRIELLMPGPSGDRWFRLGREGGGERGRAAVEHDAVLRRERLDLAHLLADSGQILERDADAGFARRLFGLGDDDVAPRSIAAVLVSVETRPIACLVVGANEPARYARRDIRLLTRVAALIGPRVDPFVTAWHLQVLRRHVAAAGNLPSQLGRLAEQLAGATDLATVAGRFAAGAAEVLMFDQLRLALRIGDGSRAAVMSPGDARPIGDLPRTTLAGTPLGQVIGAHRPHLLLQSEVHADLMVPLRVAGEIVGALILSADAAAFHPADLAVAQQLADLVAPHIAVHAGRPRGERPGAGGAPTSPRLRSIPSGPVPRPEE